MPNSKRRKFGIDGIDMAFEQPFFKEFTVKCRDGAGAFISRARQSGFDVGPGLSSFDGPDDHVLISVTECRSREEIDRLVKSVQNSGHSNPADVTTPHLNVSAGQHA